MKKLVCGAQNLVSFLHDAVEGKYSKKFIRRILEANLCRVNGKIERFGSVQVHRGDVVELAPAWKSVASPAVASLQVLYEDENICFVDKPIGWVCDEHNCRRTFAQRLSLVHRLDKDTTGVLALAKGTKNRDEWMRLFADKKLTKHYIALVDGIPKEEEGVQESFLARKKILQGQTVWGSAAKGLHAVTCWKKIAHGKNSALLLCQPQTGRTHQIRVHLAEMGHPILVDRQYAERFRCSFFAQRPFLHALRLQYQELSVSAPLPQDMKQAIHALGMSIKNLDGCI